MLAKKSKPPKEPKTPNPNKPPPKPTNPNKPAPKPANPNKPEPNTPNPNKPTVETPAPGPTLPPVPDGALCLKSCCNAEVFEVCGGSNTQADLVTKGECPTVCTPWGA